VLLGSAVLTLVQEYRAGTAVERLRTAVVLRIRVIGDGAVAEIPASDVVPGDVVLLSAGSLVPARNERL
jgi:Mg2+-importing ATPase